MLNLARDWRTWDGLEWVKVTSYRKTNAMADLVRAKRRNPTWKEKAASAGAYAGQALVWLVPAELLQLPPLKSRDTIEDGDGNLYTVLEADYAALRSHWRLSTVNLSVVYDLADTITIERAALVYEAAGSVKKVFPPNAGRNLYAGLSCKVQQLDSAHAVDRAIEGDRVRYSIFLSRQVPDVTTEDRVNWTDDQGARRYLEIRGSHNPDRIDELPFLEAEAVP